MMVQAWNPSTWEVEAGSSSATLDFKVSLRCTDSCPGVLFFFLALYKVLCLLTVLSKL